MSTVSSYEAKTKLPELLRRAAAGERITITRRGVPVAELGPPPRAAKMTPKEAVDALLEFGRGRSLKGLSIKEMIEEGRR
jgi:prevent-host-death family protein